jgi:hypothetical protein
LNTKNLKEQIVLTEKISNKKRKKRKSMPIKDIYWRKNIKNLRRKKRKSPRNRRIGNIRLNKNSNQHDFLNFIKNSKFRKKIRIRKTSEGYAIVQIPKVFSLTENPDETLSIYNLLYNVLYKKDIKGIFFDHSKCQVLEIGASTVMDIFVMNIKEYMKRKKRDFHYSGILPKDKKHQITLFVSGLLKHLNVNDVDGLDELLDDFEGSIRKLELISGGFHSPTFKVSKQNTSDLVATEVAFYFNECLKTQDLALNNQGLDYVCQLVGETINNCELHSGDFTQWFTLGHYYSHDKLGYGECQLVLFNFGQSIYQGLKNAQSLDMLNALNKITQLHTNKGYFNIKSWDEETLWTLYALQDGVSRVKNEEEPDRGTGTVKLINSFQNIGSTIDGKNAAMSIISGNAYIYFDGSYTLQKKKIENEERDIIAFNDFNDLEEPPNKKYVKKLSNYFPGTIICMNFYIDRRFIISEKEKKNDNRSKQI